MKKIGSQILFFIFLLLLSSCSDNNKPFQTLESKIKLDSLHNGFNDVELTKELITLEKDTITIVTFGHVYGLLYHDDVFDALIAKVNEQNPDFVWILGDIVFNNTDEEWDYLMSKYESLKGIRLHAGGNHDMNYHYERYVGNRENQWEAESRFLKYIGYRYKTIEDDVANYMVVNMNDSLDRIVDYLDLMLPQLNPDKQAILFTHHSTWHSSISNADDNTSWVKKSFYKDSILVHLFNFDYLIHGDWGGEYYQGNHHVKGKKFKTFSVGNLNEGDTLFVTTLKVTKNNVSGYPSYITIPSTSTWVKKEN
jgi:hypothetical protein